MNERICYNERRISICRVEKYWMNEPAVMKEYLVLLISADTWEIIIGHIEVWMNKCATMLMNSFCHNGRWMNKSAIIHEKLVLVIFEAEWMNLL